MAFTILDDIVIYDDKVFRPARLTTTERNAIASPQQGMIIYNTTINSFEGYDGVEWKAVGGGADEFARTIAFLGL